MVCEICVVVPVYRNAATVGELWRRIRDACGEHGIGVCVLFVDDASPDSSLDTLRSLAAEDDRIGVIALQRNLGQNGAVVAGLAHAVGRAVVIMDADLQDPPEAIPRLVAGLTDFPVVFGGRRGTYQSRWRMLASHVFKRLLWVASRMRIPPDAGLFVALRGDVAEKVLASCGSHPYLVAAIARTGSAMTSVPVPRARRDGGPSAYGASELARVAWCALAAVLPSGSKQAPAAIASFPVRERIGARLAAGGDGTGGATR